jgi:hypothetical protein
MHDNVRVPLFRPGGTTSITAWGRSDFLCRTHLTHEMRATFAWDVTLARKCVRSVHHPRDPARIPTSHQYEYDNEHVIKSFFFVNMHIKRVSIESRRKSRLDSKGYLFIRHKLMDNMHM